jgi:uncharacterized peroxidase-related enzyme
MFVRILGSAAGGGFPQWNCNCANCRGVREGKPGLSARTQSSIAVSKDGIDWVLFNASPDILTQLKQNPCLQPARGLRDTGIQGIILVDAQIDHTTGLLMLREGSSLSKGEREMIITATSAANQCLYCVVAHGALLRIYEKKPLLADQVATNYRKADIAPRQRAMLDFAMKVCQQSHTVEDADFEALHTHGFDDEDIWDIAGITAFFGLSNRVANVSGMMPNPEFYTLGRLPRQK